MTAPGLSTALFTREDVLAATGGWMLCEPDRAALSAAVDTVVTDSRLASPGCMFVALAGERTDGHFFLAAAADAGASTLLVSAEQAEKRREEISRLCAVKGTVAVAVTNPLAALQALARFHMRRRDAAPGRKPLVRIGVTGSNGKTTTKEIIGSILSRTEATAVSKGNLNSDIGLPLACFDVNDAHRYAVFEMGMNRRGEMDVLSDIVRPDLALVTNIGTAHIGLLGSRDAIAEEKRKIFAHFDGRQTAFLREDEPCYRFLAAGVRGRIVLFGPGSTKGFKGSESLGLGGTIIHWEEFRIRFPLFGPHNLSNALGAISLTRHLGVPGPEIRDGLEAVTPLFGRSQIIPGPVTVVLDCYNANPDSMEKAIRFIEALPWKGRKIAVLGSMRELGDEGEAAHRALGELLAASRFDVVFLFGDEMENAWKRCQAAEANPGGTAAEANPRSTTVQWFTDMEALGSELCARIEPGDLVLIKGSRGLEMERLVPRITNESAEYRWSGEGEDHGRHARQMRGNACS